METLLNCKNANAFQISLIRDSISFTDYNAVGLRMNVGHTGATRKISFCISDRSFPMSLLSTVLKLYCGP